MTKGYDDYYNKRKYMSCSSLATCGRCPLRFFFRHGCRLGSAETHPALVFGSAADKAFGVTIRDGLDMGHMTFLEAWGEGDQEFEDKKRNTQVAYKMLQRFVSNPKPYKLAPTPPEVVKIKGRSSSEIPFVVDIGADIPFGGLVDGLCTHVETGELWILEFKTTSQLGSWYFNAFNLSTQAVGYVAAMQILGLDIKGVMVDANLVAKTKSDNVVVPVSVSPVQVDLWLRWAKSLTYDVLQYELSKDFPPNMSGCNTYNAYGQQGFPCDYTDLCKVSDWTSLVEMFTVKERSDPLQELLEGAV